MKKKKSLLKIPDKNWKEKLEKTKNKKSKILLERMTPKIHQQSSVDIQKLLNGSLRATTTPTPPSNYTTIQSLCIKLNLFCLASNFLRTLTQIITA